MRFVLPCCAHCEHRRAVISLYSGDFTWISLNKKDKWTTRFRKFSNIYEINVCNASARENIARNNTLHFTKRKLKLVTCDVINKWKKSVQKMVDDDKNHAESIKNGKHMEKFSHETNGPIEKWLCVYVCVGCAFSLLSATFQSLKYNFISFHT